MAPVIETTSSASGTTSTTLAISFPSGIDAGNDVLVVLIAGSRNSGGASTPSGWTEFGNITHNGGTTGGDFALGYWKLSDGGDTGSETFTLGTDLVASNGRMYRISGCDTSSIVADTLNTSETTAQTHTISGTDLVADNADSLCLAMLVTGSGSWDPATVTGATEREEIASFFSVVQIAETDVASSGNVPDITFDGNSTASSGGAAIIGLVLNPGGNRISAASGSFTITGYDTEVIVPSIEFVGSAIDNKAGGSSADMTFTLPAHQADDFGIIFAKSDEAGTIPNLGIGAASGWTELFQDNPTQGRDSVVACWYKKFTSSSETAPTVTTDFAEERSASIHIFRGVDTTTPFDVTYTSDSGQNNANPTNPAIETDSANAAVVLFHGFSHNDHTALGAPSGYTLGEGQTTDGNNHRGHAVAYLLDSGSAGTKTPGAWTHTASPTDVSDWSGRTLALRLAVDGDITIDLAAGSYAMTGQTLSLLTDTNVGLAAGSFSVSGLSLEVTQTVPVELASGSFSLSGLGLDISQDLSIDLAAGSFSLSGLDLDVSQTVPIDLAAGSFSVSGQALDLITDTSVDLAAGSFAVSGSDLALTESIGVELAAGSFAMSGFDVGLSTTFVIDLAAGSYSVTGQDMGLSLDKSVALSSGSFVLSGLDVGVSSNVDIDLSAGTFSLSGADLDVSEGQNVGLETGGFAVSGYALGLSKDNAVELAAGSFSLSGFDLDIGTGVPIDLAAGSFSLSGLDIGIVAGSNVDLAAGSFGLTGLDAEIRIGPVLGLETGSFGVSGYDTGMLFDLGIGLDTGDFSLSGLDCGIYGRAADVTLSQTADGDIAESCVFGVLAGSVVFGTIGE